MSSEDFEDGVQVRLGTQRSEVTEYPDPFSASGEELLKLSGLSTNFKRKIGRELQKAATSPSNYSTGSGGSFNGLTGAQPINPNAPQGKDGAGSKRMEPTEVTAYAMFSVVQPTYNLDYLAKI